MWEQESRQRTGWRHSWLLALAMIAVLVAVLWLPFGLRSTTGVFEEWLAINQMLLDQPVIFNAGNASRPMIYAPNALAHALVPHSFIGHNLLFIAIFMGRGVVAFGLMRRLVPGQRFIALLTALLFIIYPADDEMFYFRSINIHSAILLGLLSVYLLLAYWQRPRWWLWPVIWALHVPALLMHEMMYPALLAAPALLLLMERRVTWRLARVALLWWLIPASLFIRLLLILRAEAVGHYISLLYAEATESHLRDPSQMIRSLPRLYGRQITLWGYAFERLRPDSLFFWLGLGVGLLGGGLSWLYLEPRQPLRANARLYGLLIAGALALILLSFIMYLPTRAQFENRRVYFLAIGGASLIIAVLLAALRHVPRIGRGLAAALSALLLLAATSHTLYQHQHLADNSEMVQALMASMAEEAPSVSPETAIIVLDRARIYLSALRLVSDNRVLSGLVRTLYDDPSLNAYFCPPFRLHPGQPVCYMEAEHIRIADETIPYDRALIFDNLPYGHMRLLDMLPPEYLNEAGGAGYNPLALIDRDAPPPPAIQTLLTCWPLADCAQLLPDTTPTDYTRIDFDRPVYGMNWHGPAPNTSEVGMIFDRAALYIYPTLENDLRLRLTISGAQSWDVLTSLRLLVNGQPVPLTRAYNPDTSGYEHTAIIQRPYLAAITELTFVVDDALIAGPLPLIFDWLETEPYR